MPDYTSTIADLILRQGDIAAQRASTKGRFLGNTLQSLAQVLPMIEQRQQQRRVQQQQDEAAAQQAQMRGLQIQEAQGGLQDRTDANVRQQKLQAILSGPGTPYEKTQQVAQIDPKTAGDLAKKNADEVEKALLQWNPNNGDMIRKRVELYGGPDFVQAMPQTFDQNWVRQAVMDKAQYLKDTAPQQPEPAKTREVRTMENGKEVIKIVPDVPGGTYEVPPPSTPREANPTEAALALRAAQGDTEAAQALRLMRNQHPPSAGSTTGTPFEIKPDTKEFRTAQDIAYGKLTFPQIRTLLAYNRDANFKLALYDKARELNPDFDPAQFELGFKFAANPQVRQRVVAIDSLLPLIDKIKTISAQVKPGDVKGFNRLVQGAKLQVSDRHVATFQQLSTLLGDEVGLALGLGQGSDLKTKLGLSMVDTTLGTDAFNATMDQLRDTLEARRGPLVKQMGIYGARTVGDGTQPAAGNSDGQQIRVGPYVGTVRP